MINVDKLKGHIPDKILSKISGITEINSNLRLAHFLSQCAHESLNFERVTENLFYSSQGLLKTFPKYFTPDQAILYSHDPIAIGNRVYADRMGNGDEKSGDGYKYRGRGYIGITGRDNYVLLSGYLGEDLTVNPDLVATHYALESAAFFFTANHIWELCDKGSNIATITAITKKVNGGFNGIDARIKLFNKFYELVK